MAPELFRGPRRRRGATSTALGLILHELCTGSCPAASARPAARSRQPIGALPRSTPARTPTALVDRVPGRSGLRRDHRPLPRRRSGGALRLGRGALARPWSGSSRSTQPRRWPPATPTGAWRPSRPSTARSSSDATRTSAPCSSACATSPWCSSRETRGRQVLAVPRGRPAPRWPRAPWTRAGEFATLTLWPGRRPLEALAAALAPVLGRPEAELVTGLADTPPGWARRCGSPPAGARPAALRRSARGARHPRPSPRRRRTSPGSSASWPCPSTGVRVLLAVRGDFLTRVCALPGLGDGGRAGALHPAAPVARGRARGHRRSRAQPRRRLRVRGAHPDARRLHGARRGQPAAAPVRARRAVGAARRGAGLHHPGGARGDGRGGRSAVPARGRGARAPGSGRGSRRRGACSGW